MLISNGSAEPPETFLSTCRTISSSLTGPRLRVSRPASMRAASSSSVMSRLRRSASASTVSSMNWRCSSENFSHLVSSVEVNPLMPVSGDRSSCATVATRSERSRSRWLRIRALRTLTTTRRTGPAGRSRTRDAVMRYSLPLGDHQACSEIRLRVAMPSYGARGVVPGVAVEVVERHGFAEVHADHLVALGARHHPDPLVDVLDRPVRTGNDDAVREVVEVHEA